MRGIFVHFIIASLLWGIGDAAGLPPTTSPHPVLHIQRFRRGR
jgi:hypothetical protein